MPGGPQIGKTGLPGGVDPPGGMIGPPPTPTPVRLASPMRTTGWVVRAVLSYNTPVIVTSTAAIISSLVVWEVRRIRPVIRLPRRLLAGETRVAPCHTLQCDIPKIQSCPTTQPVHIAGRWLGTTHPFHLEPQCRAIIWRTDIGDITPRLVVIGRDTITASSDHSHHGGSQPSLEVLITAGYLQSV